MSDDFMPSDPVSVIRQLTIPCHEVEHRASIPHLARSN